MPCAVKRAGIVDGDGCLRHPTIKCDSNAICEAARAVAEPSNELATGKATKHNVNAFLKLPKSPARARFNDVPASSEREMFAELTSGGHVPAT